MNPGGCYTFGGDIGKCGDTRVWIGDSTSCTWMSACCTSAYVSRHVLAASMQAGLMRRIGICIRTRLCIYGSNARETSWVASGAGAVPQAARGTGRARRAFQSRAHTRLPEARHERGRRNGKPRDVFRQSLLKPRRWQKSSRSLRLCTIGYPEFQSVLKIDSSLHIATFIDLYVAIYICDIRYVRVQCTLTSILDNQSILNQTGYAAAASELVL